MKKQQEPKFNTPLEWALHYANDLGWKVFPCSQGSKKPIASSRGCLDATTDTEQIRAWWTQNPNYNVAIATGSASGIGVIDIDISATGNGFLELEAHEIEEWETVTQTTPRGGKHFVFSTNGDEVSNAVAWFGKGSAIDVRGEGGYILAHPSKTSDGVYSIDESMDIEAFPKEFNAAARKKMKAYADSAYDVLDKIDFSHASGAPEQAIEYLKHCEPAIQGRYGHYALLSACNALLHGFMLSQVQAKALLWRYYNPRCQPPWDQSNKADAKDFERKISEAARYGGMVEQGYLLKEVREFNERMGQEFANALLESVSDSVPQHEEPAPSDDSEPIDFAEQIDRIREYTFTPAELPPVEEFKIRKGDRTADRIRKEVETGYTKDQLTVPVGTVGVLSRHIAESAMKEQRWLALAASLAAHSAILGRRVRDIDDTRPNMYILGIAHSSAGKNHPIKKVEMLLEEAGAGDMIGGSDLTSDTALIRELADLPQHSGYLLSWDEAGLIFGNISKGGHGAASSTVAPALMKMYSSANAVYRGKSKADAPTVTITEPSVTLLGMTTPETFYASLTTANLRDGFLGRVLPFHSDARPVFRSGKSRPLPISVVDFFSTWYNAPFDTQEMVTNGSKTMPRPPIQVIEETESATRIREAFAHDCEVMVYTEEDDVKYLWGKAHENCRKIALIVACGDKRIINSEVMSYAVALTKMLILEFSDQVRSNVSDNMNQKDLQRVLAVIKSAGVILRTDLTRRTQSLTTKRRNEILEDLEESCLIQFGKQGKAASFKYLNEKEQEQVKAKRKKGE